MLREHSEPILSSDWYRIAHLTPRLRTGVSATRQRIRGEDWYVVTDGVSGKHFRFNEQAYQLISSFDGNASVDEVWSTLADGLNDAVPAQAEVIRIVSRAFAANLFVGNLDSDTESIIEEHGRRETKRRRALLNPLAFKVPLWDPDDFLTRHLESVRWVFSGPVRLLMSLSILVGAILLALNAGEFGRYASEHLVSGSMLLTLWLVFPAIKVMHELGHAFTVKINGGEVHELGVTLMFLTPIPYVDASASSAFPNKQDRLSVAASGIFVEAFIASVALVFWLMLEPGLIQGAMFAAVFSGALSTLLINGNPLLRFDGYYAFCDFFELPNLGTRSPRYWQVIFKRKLLAVEHARFGDCLAGERPWLFCYAPLSWAYRAVLIATAALLFANISATLGGLILTLGMWMLVGKPLVRTVRWLLVSSELQGYRLRANTIAFVLTCVSILALTVMPVSDKTHASALVWLPDNAVLRTQAEGVLREWLASDGQSVKKGDSIALLGNERLETELVVLKAQIEAQRIEQARQFDVDAQASLTASEAYRQLLGERSEMERRVSALVVKAQASGILAISPQLNIIGEHLSQGAVLAHVLPSGPATVRALVDNDDIALVRERPGKITVNLVGLQNESLVASLVSATPQSTRQLPSAALSTKNGGAIAVEASDPKGLTATEPRFAFDLKLESAQRVPVGSRALAVFDHGTNTVMGMAARMLRESFLRHFAS